MLENYSTLEYVVEFIASIISRDCPLIIEDFEGLKLVSASS